MNGGKIVDTNLICKLPVQTSRDWLSQLSHLTLCDT